ncbi:unnamed protein product [Rotaria sordida]|uniref:Reverse transcriptase domain-containing protein n=1 Tax=Rotaria sordida TaxID=392033 RepID=A0A820BAU7_9BILA|nr:unnamed protein product [Rotaria sordida]
MKVVLDTGANRTFISSKVLHPLTSKQFVNKSYKRVILADGNTSLFILSTWNLSIIMGDMLTSIQAFVVKELCADCILGMDFINTYKLIINTEEQMVSICNNHRRTTLKFDLNQGDISYPTRLINNIRIPPKRSMLVPVSVRLSSAKVLFRPSFKLQQRLPILMLNSSLTVHRHTSFISLHNPTNYLCSLSKGIILGTTTIPTLSFKRNLTIDHRLVNMNIISLIQHIDDHEQQDKVRIILNQHAKLFDASKPSIATGVKPHAIKTFDHPPPTSKPFYTSPSKQEEMYKITQELLHFGLIRPSYLPYTAPALLVPKHDGTWRMVVDYKKLNNVTIKDNHPLPNLEQAIQILGGGYKFFSKLDMKSGFWQIPIEEEDKHKTASIITEGLYEWNVLAQGLKNSPPSFQRVMADILFLCRQFALVYIDDIVVFSRSLSEFGVKPNNEKIQAIIKLREPSTLAEANKFLGAILWYRKFIPQFATVAAPIHRVTTLTKPNRRQFVWCDAQKQAFL